MPDAPYCLVPAYAWDDSIRGWVKVDVDVADEFGRYRWSFRGKPHRPYVAVYVAARGGRRGGRGHYLILHRHLLGCAKGDGVHVDHLNGDTLDNRRVNLHAGTPSENMQNRHRGYGRSSFRGVTWDSKRQKWVASAKAPGRRWAKHLGRFDTEEEAAAIAAAFRAEHMPHSPEAIARRATA